MAKKTDVKEVKDIARVSVMPLIQLLGEHMSILDAQEVVSYFCHLNDGIEICFDSLVAAGKLTEKDRVQYFYETAMSFMEYRNLREKEISDYLTKITGEGLN